MEEIRWKSDKDRLEREKQNIFRKIAKEKEIYNQKKRHKKISYKRMMENNKAIDLASRKG